MVDRPSCQQNVVGSTITWTLVAAVAVVAAVAAVAAVVTDTTACLTAISDDVVDSHVVLFGKASLLKIFFDTMRSNENEKMC